MPISYRVSQTEISLISKNPYSKLLDIENTFIKQYDQVLLENFIPQLLNHTALRTRQKIRKLSSIWEMLSMWPDNFWII